VTRRGSRAWRLMLPAMAGLVFVGIVPRVAVVNGSFHDIFRLDRVQGIGTGWNEDIVTWLRFRASLGRSLRFAGLVLAIRVPPCIAVVRFPVRSGRSGRGMLPMFAADGGAVGHDPDDLVDANTGYPDGLLPAAGFDAEYKGWHTRALIVAMDTRSWLGLMVILSHTGPSSIPPACRRASRAGRAGTPAFRLWTRAKRSGGSAMARR
jgi:glycerol transport system permease protein